MKEALNAAAVSLESIKGDIVTGTLDTLNTYGGKKKKKSKNAMQSAMSDSYDFNKTVLSAAYEGKGTIIDSKR